MGRLRLRAGDRRLLIPLVVLACASAFVVQSVGWAQTSYLALTKAFAHGTAQIDRNQWETRDKAWYKGHFYSVKAPGVVALTLPLYELLHVTGAEKLAHDARVTGESGGAQPWAYRGLQVANYGGSRARAIATRSAIEDDAPMAWMLGLVGVVLPGLLLLVMVSRLANRVARGTGPAAALTLGAGTMMLPFSTLLFSHVLSAALGFAAFALAWRERDGAPRLRLLAVAGLAAGLAITTEYPLGIAAVIVGGYVLARRDGGRVRRAVHYGAGVVAGVIPLLAYNVWAFGSPFHMSYADAVAEQGKTGHATLGLNDGGLFGITLPRPSDAVALLFSGRGLITLTPIVVIAVAGVVAMHRDGHRAEARTIAAIAIAYFLYVAGYWLPFGGGSPQSRFLIPVLPFLAIGLGPAWRRWPAVTLALAVVSATTMTVATISYPMIGGDDPGEWAHRLVDWHLYQHTLLDITGVAHGIAAIVPFVVLVALALGLGVRTLAARHLVRGLRWAGVALVAWAAAAAILPNPLGWAPCTQKVNLCSTTSAASGNVADMQLFGTAAVAGLLALTISWVAARRLSAQEVDEHAGSTFSHEPEPAQAGA
ncbi:MAG: hypothetical protein JWN32_2970 [Solirubrobacterales bacterium]|nr:hypothetical protein [Solirubrobacterales bacterium]